jgi:uncharacterized membrane protein YqaE (UPF0057 family)
MPTSRPRTAFYNFALSLLCVFCPPIAVFLTGRLLSFFLSLILTLCGWLPGVIHAFFVVSDYKNEKRIRALTDELRR